MLLTYKYRLYPNRSQSDAIANMLDDFCALYNAGLQQRIEAYQRRGVSLSYGMQAGELKATRAAYDRLAQWSFSAEQQVLRRLDKSFRAFFGRVKRGDKAGFPRFRASVRYHAAEFRVGDGLTLRKSGRIGIVGIPSEVKVKWHRDLPSKPKSAILTRQNGKWYIVFHVEIEAAEECIRDSIGIDAGLTSLVALSNGETVSRPNWTKRAKRGLRIRQRALARCKRGSRRRANAKVRLAAYSRNVASRRRDMLHKLSSDITIRFSHIAVENLNIRGLARGMLSREVNDAAWAQLISMLVYKAAKAGGQVIKVDPRGTSQTCPECGTIKAKTLSERVHRCECGCVMDRDVAAAKIVHIRAFPHGTCGRTPSQRVAA
jgi:putative transposase